MKVKESKKPKQQQQPKGYVPKKTIPQPVDENNFLIKVTYPKEVARIFRKEYVKMIEQIEWELTYTDEKTQIAEMNKKLDQLQKELMCFNSYNPK